MKALIIDDSPISRRVITHVLKTQDIDSVVANDGLEGLQLLKSNEGIGFVTIDLCMPNMSGIEFVKEVRRCREFDSVKLIVISACDERANASVALKSGADDFLSKPISHDVLERVLTCHGLN